MRKNDCLEEIEVYLMAALENTASSLKAKRELKETKVKHNIKEKSSYKCVCFFFVVTVRVATIKLFSFVIKTVSNL